MNKADHFREAETALGTQSREQAEAELKNVGAECLAASLTEFIEWRAFPVGSGSALRAPARLAALSRVGGQKAFYRSYR